MDKKLGFNEDDFRFWGKVVDRAKNDFIALSAELGEYYTPAAAGRILNQIDEIAEKLGELQTNVEELARKRFTHVHPTERREWFEGGRTLR